MTQWLPLLGSLPVAGAVLVGVFANNRTHRDAIAAADERGRQALDAAQRHVELSNMVGDQRDHESWRREAVLAGVASILETSASVRADLASCGDWELLTVEEIDNAGAQIHKLIWGGPSGMLTRLRVVAHRRIPNKCEDLLRTLTVAQHITMQRLKLHIDVEATVEELEEMASLWQKAMRHAAEQERALVETTRIELGIEIASKTAGAEPVPAPARPVTETVSAAEESEVTAPEEPQPAPTQQPQPADTAPTQEAPQVQQAADTQPFAQEPIEAADPREAETIRA
ncbi:hypothetical protein [Nocardia caishijiensis]|uniref:Secreted protein n=1 Tax=Nocardia caishijiensis TaxID=184756 RepID=A0ABQ6YUQ3_9NOCA|nr:hypothetical protein [Nocardia caishijiensis]KAF0849426.1 hypothetical protein FNL39_101865 [Nocardia caishijiensis]